MIFLNSSSCCTEVFELLHLDIYFHRVLGLLSNYSLINIIYLLYCCRYVEEFLMLYLSLPHWVSLLQVSYVSLFMFHIRCVSRMQADHYSDVLICWTRLDQDGMELPDWSAMSI